MSRSEPLDFDFILGTEEYKVKYELIFQRKLRGIDNESLGNRKYIIKTDLKKENMNIFLEFLKHCSCPDININNLQELKSLSEELQFKSLKRYISSFEEKIIKDKYVIDFIKSSTNSKKHKSAGHNMSDDNINDTGEEKQQNDISIYIKFVAENLDFFLAEYWEIMKTLEFKEIFEIFIHSSRKMINVDKGYQFIKEMIAETGKKEYYWIFRSFHAEEMSKEMIEEIYLNIKDEEIEFVPQFHKTFLNQTSKKIRKEISEEIQEEMRNELDKGREEMKEMKRKQEEKSSNDSKEIEKLKDCIIDIKAEIVEKMEEEKTKAKNDYCAMEELYHQTVKRLLEIELKFSNMENKMIEYEKKEEEERKILNEKFETEFEQMKEKTAKQEEKISKMKEKTAKQGEEISKMKEEGAIEKQERDFLKEMLNAEIEEMKEKTAKQEREISKMREDETKEKEKRDILKEKLEAKIKRIKETIAKQEGEISKMRDDGANERKEREFLNEKLDIEIKRMKETITKQEGEISKKRDDGKNEEEEIEEEEIEEEQGIVMKEDPNIEIEGLKEKISEMIEDNKLEKLNNDIYSKIEKLQKINQSKEKKEMIDQLQEEINCLKEKIVVKKSKKRIVIEKSESEGGILQRLKEEEEPFHPMFVSSVSSRDPFDLMRTNWTKVYYSNNRGKFFIEFKIEHDEEIKGILIKSADKSFMKGYQILIDGNIIYETDGD